MPKEAEHYRYQGEFTDRFSQPLHLEKNNVEELIREMLGSEYSRIHRNPLPDIGVSKSASRRPRLDKRRSDA